MAFGVTAEGFVPMRLADIKSAIEVALTATFGEINLEASSNFGQFVGVMSKIGADWWEALEDVYNSQYPSSAVGAGLDNVVSLNSLTRRAAVSTQVYCRMTGDEGTVIPVDSQVENDNGDLFSLSAETEITVASAIKLIIEVTFAATQIYRITINSLNYDYSATVPSDTAEDIANALVSAITAGEPLVNASNVAEIITIEAADCITPFSQSFGCINIRVNELSSVGSFVADETGPIVAVAEGVASIVTPVSGWDSVINDIDGDTGAEEETDAELRQRREQSLSVVGASTVDAIRARILDEVVDVTACSVYENNTDSTDADGRPPHSIEVIITGGTDQDIADKLWEVKAGGIQTFGTSSGTVVDSNSENQTVYFSRPIQKYVHVKVTIDSFYSEEQFPIDGADQIKTAIYNFGLYLPLGRDLIIQRWNTPIYSIDGIGAVTIEHAVTTAPGDSPSWVSVNIPLGSTYVANMAVARVTVVLP